MPTKPRLNDIRIQMLSESLYQQIFQNGKSTSRVSKSATGTDISRPQSDVSYSVSENNSYENEPQFQLGDQEHSTQYPTMSRACFEKVKKHLTDHKLWDKQVQLRKDVEFQLPPLKGKNIDAHFRQLAEAQVKEYVQLAQHICTQAIPQRPTEWAYCPGWVKYDLNGIPIPVDYPEEHVMVLDVEILMQDGNYPALATAVTDKHWYSWCSDYLVTDKFHWTADIRLSDLIPLETTSGSDNASEQHRLVIGHNVAFDRTFVKEQYYIRKSKLRFMDTMSMHIAVCGLTNFQRVLYQATKKDSKLKAVLDYKEKQRQRGQVIPEDWKEVSSMNSLKEVHQLHVGGKELDKDPRNIFMEGTVADVRDNFQELMDYCASDAAATLEVFKELWPEFNDRFPHPVTLAGMLEMSTGYLPVNQNWQRYIHQSNAVYQDMQRESKQLLMRLANEACSYLKDDRYKKDPWLWNLDWSVKPFRIKKAAQEKKKSKKKKTSVETDKNLASEEEEESFVEKALRQQENHYKNTGDMVGYPEWYRLFCSGFNDEDWKPGPWKVSYQMRATPKLLRLTWDGYIIDYDDTHGWGYLVPGRTDNLEDPVLMKKSKDRMFPYKELLKVSDLPVPRQVEEKIDLDSADDEQFEDMMDKMLNGVAGNKASIKSYDHLEEFGSDDEEKPKKTTRKQKEGEPNHVGDGPHNSVDKPGCWFFRIPHKDGKGKKVGNPLAKDYLNRVVDGTLSAQSGSGADMVLKLNKACSYWKNNQDRIESQMSVWLMEDEMPDAIKKSPDYIGQHLGAILPRIIPAGTITRRGVEPTWLTASNAYVDRIGSELKAMVQSPPGYCFVGADVDSQELWIGAVLGDAHFGKSHGCTALGWMTLQGSKKEGTDLHSVVANTVGISRDHAKVFNYGRIYGAGQTFAEKLLQQFNHRMSKEEAKQKAQLMFSTTKGRRSRINKKWHGGSESAMFNKLEAIAREAEPRTPVLGCRLSRALEPDNVYDGFMTSRINWVVQSSAVDYLHLMLVCMRWLFDEYNIKGRFCISIHDEVRYLVEEEDCYRAALALQITNLLTRSMFSYKLGINDLPLSVAFFSAVDIDTCLRKEVDLDCVTPSNPHGLQRGYNIPKGTALDIHQILEKTGGELKKSSVENQEKVLSQPVNNMISCPLRSMLTQTGNSMIFQPRQSLLPQTKNSMISQSRNGLWFLTEQENFFDSDP